LKEGLVTVKEQQWEFVDGKKEKIQSAGKGVPVQRDQLIDWIEQRQVIKQWKNGLLIGQ
jgi:histidyl-tRNA synthetase